MPAAPMRRASAPGRVTLLGEHTDYNAGVALAVATTQRTFVACTPLATPLVEVASSSLGTATIETTSTEGPAFAVLAAALCRAAGVVGARLDVDGDLPVGAGLSSSAAYAVAVALALGVRGTAVEVATTCQTAERAAGSDVGLLDQLAILCARRGAVVDVAFDTLTVSTFQMADSIGLTVVDSGVRRALAASPYAVRRAQCEQAAAIVGPLGLATAADLAALDDPTLRRRARHVVTECARVRDAKGPLRSGDLNAFGGLLDEGHVSLRDDFESSTDAVDAARDALRRMPGVQGVRLTGAGFGGCLLVAHDPDATVDAGGAFSARVVPGEGAALSPAR